MAVRRLTSEQVEASTMALAFVRALLLGTNPKENKAHEINPCAVAYWEESYKLDDDLIPFVKGIDANRKK